MPANREDDDDDDDDAEKIHGHAYVNVRTKKSTRVRVLELLAGLVGDLMKVRQKRMMQH